MRQYQLLLLIPKEGVAQPEIVVVKDNLREIPTSKEVHDFLCEHFKKIPSSVNPMLLKFAVVEYTRIHIVEDWLVNIPRISKDIPK